MSYRLWHRVVVHALLGEDRTELGEQDQLDPVAVDALIGAERERVLQVWHERLDAGLAWPVPPTPELSTGLPWAQYATAVHRTRVRHELQGAPARARAFRPPDDPQTRRLMADRPPHW